jgi:hypothetical protein
MYWLYVVYMLDVVNFILVMNSVYILSVQSFAHVHAF